MKANTLISFCLAGVHLLTAATCNERMTNAEIRRLSPEQWSQLRQNATKEVIQQLDALDVELYKREAMGEEAWERRVRNSVLSRRGFDGLISLLDFKDSLPNRYDDVTRAIANATPDTEERMRRIQAAKNVFHLEMESQWNLLLSVAPTADALRINDIAQKAADGWRNRDPVEIKPAEIKEIDNLVQKLLDELKALPQLSPSQVMEERDNLPFY